MGLLGKLEGFGKAVWDAGNEVVDVIGDVDAVVEGVGAIAGFIGRIGKSTHLDDLIEVGERLGGWAEQVGLNKFLRAADSPILDGGQVVIAGMKLTTGIGEPEHGDRFGRGGARFHDAGTTLRSAQPTASWSGEGADAYAAQNVSQTARTKAIAAVDHEVHRVSPRKPPKSASTGTASTIGPTFSPISGSSPSRWASSPASALS